MVNCVPYGGISNRMKCIISTVAEYGWDINLNWRIPSTGGGVRCNFNDLFENVFNKNLNELNNKVVTHCEFIHKDMNINNEMAPNLINTKLTKKYINVIKQLTPIQYIRDRVDSELKCLPEQFNLYSVRTFKSFPEENLRWGRHFKLNRLFDQIEQNETPFLLTCDDTSTVNDIKNRYGDRVLTIKKRTTYGDFKSIHGMQDILIDQLIGGYARNIYGTYMSSFSEMQWWYGLQQSSYIQMNLHI